MLYTEILIPVCVTARVLIRVENADLLELEA